MPCMTRERERREMSEQELFDSSPLRRPKPPQQRYELGDWKPFVPWHYSPPKPFGNVQRCEDCYQRQVESGGRLPLSPPAKTVLEVDGVRRHLCRPCADERR